MNEQASNEKIESHNSNQTEDSIKSYWSEERQEKAEPIPLPSVPPKEQTQKPRKKYSKSSEVISEPGLPNKNTE